MDSLTATLPAEVHTTPFTHGDAVPAAPIPQPQLPSYALPALDTWRHITLADAALYDYDESGLPLPRLQ